MHHQPTGNCAGGFVANSLNNQFLHAMNSEDAEAISDMFADDVVVMHSTGQVDIGKERASEVFAYILKDRDVQETATVKDAILLTDDDLLTFSDFDLYYSSRDGRKPINFRGEAIALSHRENGMWKLKRLIGLTRGEGMDAFSPSVAHQLPGNGDWKAMQVARDAAAQLVFSYNKGMTDLSQWASNFEGYVLSGSHVTYDSAPEHYAEVFRETDMSIALNPSEAFFVGDDILYAFGTGHGNYRDKKTGEASSIPPFEYVQILRNDSGTWHMLRGYSFRRVLKPVSVGAMPMLTGSR